MDYGSSKTTKHHHKRIKCDYKAIVGIMPQCDSKQQIMATMSYIAYIKESNIERPITFIWGGGPGYCSLMDNFAHTGPMTLNPSTQCIEENNHTWLEFTDLVYIDMIGSGWGRLASPSEAKQCYSPAGDADVFCQFIETFLRHHQRLSSPIYLGGSSYGGLRATLVAKNLLRATISVHGLFLGSPELNDNYRTPCEFGNDMAYVYILPTFIRAALYHKKLSKKFQQSAKKTLEEGIAWSQDVYPNMLLKGDSLSSDEKKQLAQTLHDYIGLDLETIHKHHYRISLEVFNSHLLGEKDVNYLDVRISDYKLNDFYNYFIFTMSNLMELQLSVHTKAIDFIAKQLAFTSDEQYIVYVSPDDWFFDPAYKQVISVLRDCILIDDKLKVFVALGYFDADIPYMSNVAAINHLLLPQETLSRVKLKCYQEGHLFSLNPASLKIVTNDVKDFLF